MIHARTDYDRIQDPENKIGEDEPVFLLRAKDVLAPEIVYAWAMRLDVMGGDKELVEHVKDWSSKMRKWQQDNESKVPDTPIADLREL